MFRADGASLLFSSFLTVCVVPTTGRTAMHYASRERQKIQKLENLRQEWLKAYHKSGASHTSPLVTHAALSLLHVGAVEGKRRSEDEQHKLDKAVAEVLGREHNKDKLELFLQVIGARVIELRHLSVNVRSCDRAPKHVRYHPLITCYNMALASHYSTTSLV